MKHCPKCGVVKSLDEFHRRRESPDGRASHCKVCRLAYQREYGSLNREALRKKSRAWYAANKERASADNRRRRLSTYGLTIEQYEERLRSQGGRCAICRTSQPGTTGRFVVDHCHDAGHVRGLLCGRCNRGIGLLGDHPEILRLALAYVEAGAR